MLLIFMFVLVSYTLSEISKLSTHNSCVNATPGIITHSAPQIVPYTDLHSALIWNVTFSQLQLTRCAWSCATSMYNMLQCEVLKTFILNKTYLYIEPQHHESEDSYVSKLAC